MATRRSREKDDSEEDIPLHHKQPFGAGIKRKRVEFVRAQDTDKTAATASLKRENGNVIGDIYASLVLGANTPSTAGLSSTIATVEVVICETCGLEVKGTIEKHNATLAHQSSIPHSHPPSHLDRSRMGLRALASQGWDPDARVGLGASGSGVRFPIKTTPKEDTLGIGAVVPVVKKEKKVEIKKTLNKQELRKVRVKERERHKFMEREIYGRGDVERILRGEGSGGDGLR